jgi:N-acetylmuramoyl-L-alanine amidase
MSNTEIDKKNWSKKFDFEPCDDINHVEETALGARAATFTETVQNAPGCSTMVANGLSQQLIHEVNLIIPGVLVGFDDLNVDLGDAAYPFLQPPAKNALAKAIRDRNKTLRVNSAYRTIVQQCLLYKWRGGRGGCPYGLVAAPGKSNHQGGLAIDINDHLDWRPFLEKYGWQWFGNKDKPHFTYVGGGTKDIRNNAIKAFQRLWNKNHPADQIKEDGVYGDNTEARINRTSVKGFSIAPWDKQPRILRFSRPISEGSDVMKVQEALKTKGFEIFPDGLFGSSTATLVRQFQEREGLVGDGIVGSKTLEKLFA